MGGKSKTEGKHQDRISRREPHVPFSSVEEIHLFPFWLLLMVRGLENEYTAIYCGAWLLCNARIIVIYVALLLLPPLSGSQCISYPPAAVITTILDDIWVWGDDQVFSDSIQELLLHLLVRNRSANRRLIETRD
jgi:hypothetical protein